jgi:hypothetical protein
VAVNRLRMRITYAPSAVSRFIYKYLIINNIFVIMLAACGIALAAEPDTAATHEIQFLFSHLERSDCEFYRNGTWHSPQEAGKHLRRKYQAMRDQGMISTADAFVEHGASYSSVSRKPYQVRCGKDARPASSAQWFHAALVRYREGSKGNSGK